MANVEPTVTLLSPVLGDYVLELLYAVHLQNRGEERIVMPEEIAEAYCDSCEGKLELTRNTAPHLFLPKVTGTLFDDADGVEFCEYYDQQIALILGLDVPLLEAISFTFVIENMTISMREQLVRHRLGAYWIQSGRVRDQSRFATDDKWRMPPSIRDHDRAKEIFKSAMLKSQDAFNRLVSIGVNVEDARDVLPPAQLHRGSVTMHYRALKQMVGRRTAFVAQAGHWLPMLASLSQQVREIDERLGWIFEPPEIKNGKYIGQVAELEHRRRFLGHDPTPPCPIYMKYEAPIVAGDGDIQTLLEASRGVDAFFLYVGYASQYVPVWGEPLILEHCWCGDLIVKMYKDEMHDEDWQRLHPVRESASETERKHNEYWDKIRNIQKGGKADDSNDDS